MYKVREALLDSVGFRGYFAGFEAKCVISDNEFASTLESLIFQQKYASGLGQTAYCSIRKGNALK
jgi:hypothetical protein